MPKESNEQPEIIKANKYHKDTGFQFTDYSDKSFSLSNKFNEVAFFPKSKCRFFKLDQGVVECHIPAWIYKEDKMKHFFRNEILPRKQ